MSQAEVILNALRSHGCLVRGEGSGRWRASCPGPRHKHGNRRRPALVISEGQDGRVYMYCHAGCDIREILGRIGLQMADLYPPHMQIRRPDRREITDYTYQNSDGSPAILVRRIDEWFSGEHRKRYLQYHWDEIAKKWVKGLGPWRERKRPLYRLPAILKNPDSHIIMHEGEKAVEAAIQAGLIGLHTTAIGGAGNAKHTDLSPLSGRRVIVVPDNDDAGVDHANDLARRLREIGAAVGILVLPGLGHGEDVADWIPRQPDPVRAWQEAMEQAFWIRPSATAAEA